MATFEIGFVDKGTSAGTKGFLRTPCVMCKMSGDNDFHRGAYVLINVDGIASNANTRSTSHGTTDPTLTDTQVRFIRVNKGSFCVILHPEHVEKFGIKAGAEIPEPLDEEEGGAD